MENFSTYRRYLLDKSNLLIVRGSISPVIAGMQEYNVRYGIGPRAEDLKSSVTELLAGAALAAVSLSERESWGWSLTFRGMPVGFFAGVEPEGMICLRITGADGGKAAGLVQRQKEGLPLTQSHIEPRTQSPADAVEQYFTEATQTKTRIAVRADGDGVLVQALPEGGFDQVAALSADALIGHIDGLIGAGEAGDLGEVLIFYECRCSDAMISAMIEKMPEADRKELFGDRRQLEIECPRCGRQFTVTRKETGVH